MEIQRHGLFPVLVGEAHNPNHEFMKPTLEKMIMGNLTPEGFSEESTGHVTLHLDQSLTPLFEFISLAAKEWFATYMINPDIFDFNIVKTWMNIIRERGTPLHAHGDAHISFSYYVNIPEDINTPIVFHNHEHRLEPFPGCISHNHPIEWNPFNSYNWSFDVKEGQLMVFPSKLAHSTPQTSGDTEIGVKSIKDLRRKRVCLAGDIVLTYKEKAAKSLGLQPVQNWRVFKTDPNQ